MAGVPEGMGELFRQDTYPKEGEGLGSEPMYPAGQLSRDAGIADIRRYGPPPRTRFGQPQYDTGAVFRGVTRMINPDRFHEAQLGWPQSQAPTIYEPSYYQNWQGM